MKRYEQLTKEDIIDIFNGCDYCPYKNQLECAFHRNYGFCNIAKTKWFKEEVDNK